ncbi:MAG: protein-methionine-sulfoxide reductase catalytic subunit MsrP [Methylophaga sp.]|nr:MAG: protein-methionine-sulfoxide reductase catalytic subunit MsrP [Methylophaga sp.]
MFIGKKRLGEDIAASEITDHPIYLDRRKFLNGTAAIATASLLPFSMLNAKSAVPEASYLNLKQSPYSTDEGLTTYESVTTYNNYYEFGTGKSDPAIRLESINFPDKSKPWRVSIEGECDKPGEYDYDDLIRPFTLEERIYRFRCVEGWSMVIPWVGFPLADLIKRAQPNSRAKFVEFTTFYDPEIMIRRNVLDWPYTEGLRMDEAMNPLTLLAVGLYGSELLGQNGAPIRLVTPWKYGFKSIKSIVKIRFVESMPQSAWMKAGPKEYGFYSNVNPDVDHPRWSQSKERRLGEFLKRKTAMFNGYEEHVAHLYTGMDLTKNF